MKKELLVFLLVVVLASGGAIFSLSSQVSADNTAGKYDVKVASGSSSEALISVSNGTPFSLQGTGEGATFRIIVDSKLKTEKLKTGNTNYYSVTLLKNSFKFPVTYYTLDTNKFKVTAVLAKDAIGKLYTSGGDVDISQVVSENKTTTKIGNGVVDGNGSLIIPVDLLVTVFGPNGKVLMKSTISSNLTTGSSQIQIKGSKSGLEGKTLPNQLVGAPLDLSAGTGTLVSTAAVMNIKLDPKGAPPVVAAALTINSTLEDLGNNPATYAVLVKYMGEANVKKGLSLAPKFPLKALLGMSPDMKNLNIKALDADIQTAASGGKAPAVQLVGDVDILGGQSWILQITTAKK